jgi:hypothetical protein
MRRCSSPLSPIALRAALIRELNVDSETIRPFHTASSKVVLADDALTVADQVLEELKNLRLERNQIPDAPQLSSRRIQRAIFKGVEHRTTSRIGGRGTSTGGNQA